MQLSTEISSREELFLELERQASEPYLSFVYPSLEVAAEVNRYLLSKRACEFAPPHGRLALDDAGEVVGMVAWLSGADLARARLQATMALAQLPLFRGDPEIGQRLRLAASTLWKVEKSDFYLSRVTVTAARRGQGIGGELMYILGREADAAGAERVTLEVAAHAAAAIDLYRRHGFVEVDRRRVVHEPSGRSLEYVHMAHSLGARRVA